MGGFLFLSRITLPGDHRGWEAVHGGTGDLGVPQLHPEKGSLSLLRSSDSPIAGQGFMSKTINFLTNRVHYCSVVSFSPNCFLPFQFFAPLKPTRIMVEYNSHGDATGEADVHFESHEDAVAAMAKEGSQLRK